MDGSVRVRMAVGPSAPGRAAVGVAAGDAPAEELRRSLLTTGLALMADALGRVPEPERAELLRELADTGPADVVQLAAARRRDGLVIDPGPLDPAGARPSADRADLVADAGDEPEDAAVIVRPGAPPAALSPATVARLVPVALARRMPRDPVMLGRIGVAVGLLAKEAAVYPATLREMVPGLAAAARDPDALREFGRLSPEDAPVRGARRRRAAPRDPPPLAWATLAGVAAVLLTIAGALVASLAYDAIDPATANRATVLVLGGAAGAGAGLLVALALARAGRRRALEAAARATPTRATGGPGPSGGSGRRLPPGPGAAP